MYIYGCRLTLRKKRNVCRHDVYKRSSTVATDTPTAQSSCSNTKRLWTGEKEKVIMKYVTCPVCGRRLCKGEAGTAVEIDCPKCGKTMFVRIGKTGTLVSENPITKQAQGNIAV